jgi:intein/homing endonuclease
MERLKVIQDAFIELGIKTEIVTDDDSNHLVFKNHNSIIEEALVKELKNAKKELSMIKKITKLENALLMKYLIMNGEYLKSNRLYQI